MLCHVILRYRHLVFCFVSFSMLLTCIVRGLIWIKMKAYLSYATSDSTSVQFFLLFHIFGKLPFYLLRQVVYAIMHRQEVFQPFKNHPRFNELLENIFNVCVEFLFQNGVLFSLVFFYSSCITFDFYRS